MGDLLKVAVSGILASGKILVAATMNAEDMIEAWNSLFPPGTVLTSLDQAFVTGQKGNGSDDGFGNDWKNLRTPNMYLSGTVIYRSPLVFCPRLSSHLHFRTSTCWA
jgi:chitinase